MALATNEQLNNHLNQLNSNTNVITVSDSPDGGIVTAAIQQDDISENIEIASTAGLQLSNNIVELSKL